MGHASQVMFQVEPERREQFATMDGSTNEFGNLATAAMVEHETVRSPKSKANNASFLAPKVYHVEARKLRGPIGVSLKINRDSQIRIANIHPGSVFQNTKLKPGQFLLAVNGTRVDSRSQALEHFRDTPISASLTLTTSDHFPKSGLCKLAVEPSFYHNPGIAFGDFRNGLMVRIQRLFEGGPFRINDPLAENDIVLAVNAVPVSNAENAYKALKLSFQKRFMEIYVIDHRLCVHKVMAQTRNRFVGAEENIDFDIKIDEQQNAFISVNTTVDDSLQGLWFNHDTFFIHQSAENRPPVTDSSSSLLYQKSHTRKENCQNFVKLFNQLMEKQLRKLEEIVCCEVWKHHAGEGKSTTMSDVAERTIAMAEVLEVPTSFAL